MDGNTCISAWFWANPKCNAVFAEDAPLVSR